MVHVQNQAANDTILTRKRNDNMIKATIGLMILITITALFGAFVIIDGQRPASLPVMQHETH